MVRLVNDDYVALGAERGESEDGDAERQRDGELAELADQLAERPRRKCVDRRHERDREQDQQQVANSQADHADRGPNGSQ